MTKRQVDFPDSKDCEWCETPFAPVNYRQRFCSTKCGTASSNSRKHHQCGPCPTCGQCFASRQREKVYCSLQCYVSSDQFRAMQLENAKKLCPKVGTPRICVGCGAEFPRSRVAKFCNKQCRRKYFADRFDRWIANPEEVALPQNFDEFLSQDSLPCLIAGCSWRGDKLGNHVNFVHGIDARAFKMLAGFNLKTGLITPESWKRMSDRMTAMVKDGTMKGFSEMSNEARKSKPPGTYKSLEGREHAMKSRADLPRVNEDKTLPCLACGATVQQPTLGQKLYCSTICRSKYYLSRRVGELKCSHCGNKFDAGMNQIRRSRKGLNVCCSQLCRNRLNMVACLAARGIKYTPTEQQESNAAL